MALNTKMGINLQLQKVTDNIPDLLKFMPELLLQLYI